MKCKVCGEELDDHADVCLKCGASVSGENDTLDIKICPKCQSQNALDSKFCNKCGWNFETNQPYKRRCPKCGTESDDSARFCLKCGYEFEKKAKSNKKTVLIIIAIMIVIALGCSGTVYYMHEKAEQEAIRDAERQRQELITSYQLKAIELNDAIQEADSNFELLSVMFDSSTGIHTGLLGPSFFTSYVEGMCSEEISEEKARKRDVDKIFGELNDIECTEPEIEKLSAAIEDYYYAYVERYELLVEMDFTTDNFGSKDSTSKKNYSEAQSAVKAIIDSIEVPMVDDSENKDLKNTINDEEVTTI